MSLIVFVFFFKQKTAYEMRISDWSSDVCSSDLAGRHLLGLVDDLADLQNIERPGFKAARDEIDLGDLARRAVGLLGMKAEEKGIRIDAPRTDDRAPATGELRRVLQVLLTLPGNAIRYAPENSQLDRKSPRLNSSHYSAHRM